MLLNYNSTQPLYVVGQSISANEIFFFITQEIKNQAKLITKEDLVNLPDHSQCIIGFQNINDRTHFIKQDIVKRFNWPSFIHSQAYVANPWLIQQGVVIWPQVFIGIKTEIGEFSSIAQQCSIGHGSNLGQNNILCPSTVIGGSTSTEQNVFFGQNVCVKDQIKIGKDITFLMSSVVTKNIKQSGTYFGNRTVPKITI